jgi:hypothetical protein
MAVLELKRKGEDAEALLATLAQGHNDEEAMRSSSKK